MLNQVLRHLLIGILTLPLLAFAEKDATPREKLYAVELIVFERFDRAEQQDPEIWPKDVSLAYSYPWQRLLDLAQQDSLDGVTSSEQARRLAEYRQQDIAQGEAKQTDEMEPAPVPIEQPPVGQPTEDSSIETHQLYFYLPQQQTQLSAQARSLNRAPELRILYHRRWRQPLLSQQQAPALILSGGNLFGDHYELEGSITLFLSRYIHLRTNLWLTQFVPNHGQAEEHWPTLPTPPWAVATTTELFEEGGGVEPDQALGQETAMELPTEGSLYSSALAEQQLSPPLDSWLTEEREQSPYLVNQVVTMTQARRMRSNELHYLDHPRLGLLIKVTPVEVEPNDESASEV